MRYKTCLLTWGGMALAALVMTGSAWADDDVPALLQFAEQYQQQRQQPVIAAPANTEKSPAPKAPPPQKKPLRPASPTGGNISATSVQSRQQLARQRLELEVLRQEVTALRAEKAACPAVTAPTPLPDLHLLQRWVAGLSESWRGSPDALRSAALLRQATQQTSRAQQATVQANEQLAALRLAAQQTREAHEQRQREDQQVLQALRTSLQDNEQKLAKQKTITQQTQAELDEVRKRSSRNITPIQLVQDNVRLSYAAGVALGLDIQTLMAERQEWGVPVDQDGLMAGIIDRVSGHLRLPQAQLTQLIQQADATANAAREKQRHTQGKRGEDYLTTFKKSKGATRSPMGFWYRIDYAGEGELAENAVIDVVVKESLTDGTVIQDMELSGKVLSQPLSAFPPLFREAIGHLRNHGSLTLVVPPALAYGETGYPPKVPPNATMVYTLRIDHGVTPQPENSTR